jgi:hypothetical protein
MEELDERIATLTERIAVIKQNRDDHMKGSAAYLKWDAAFEDYVNARDRLRNERKYRSNLLGFPLTQNGTMSSGYRAGDAVATTVGK